MKVKERKKEEKIVETPKEKTAPTSTKTSFCRACAYFIIYSFVGFVIETLFALINYGVLESRQGFLYGPFCCIYGLGAVTIIVCLRSKFFKNNYTLFAGGFLVGSAVEYCVSWFGETFLNVKWWDYSNRFLNIHGRICLMYSIFWGLLGLYLLKAVNPLVDRFINWLKTKINIIILKVITYLLMIFLLIDCILSAYAISVFLIRVSIEQDLPVSNRPVVEQTYYNIYGNEKKSEFIYKHWNNDKMLLTYPNLTLTLEDNSSVQVKNYYPDARIYYHKFEKNLQKIIQ